METVISLSGLQPVFAVLEVDASVNQKIWEFLLSGGIFMGFIAICSFVAFAVAIHRLISLRWRSVLPPELVGRLERAERIFQQGHAIELFRELDASDSPIGRIGCVAMLPEHGTREEAQDAVEATAREEVVRLRFVAPVLTGPRVFLS